MTDFPKAPFEHEGAFVHLHVSLAAGADAPTLVALHGFGGSGADFEALIARTSAHLNWVCPDLPGHGQTRHPEHARFYSIAFARRLTAALVRAAGANPPVFLLGYSMGGRIALQLLARDRATAASLRRAILVGATPGIADPRQRAERRARDLQFAAHIRSLTPDAFAHWWESLPIIASQSSIPAPWGERLRARRRANDCARLARSMHLAGTGSMTPVWNRLHGIPCPVLAIAGARDPAFRDTARAMHAANPAILCADIPNAGHCAHLEQPNAFAALLRRSIPCP